jgi:hypothetical protein
MIFFIIYLGVLKIMKLYIVHLYMYIIIAKFKILIQSRKIIWKTMYINRYVMDVHSFIFLFLFTNSTIYFTKEVQNASGGSVSSSRRGLVAALV